MPEKSNAARVEDGNKPRGFSTAPRYTRPEAENSFPIMAERQNAFICYKDA
jgi:hypothetical protein